MEHATLRTETSEARTEETGALTMRICYYPLGISVIIYRTSLAVVGGR